VLAAGIDLREYRHCAVGFIEQLCHKLPRKAKLELVRGPHQSIVRTLMPYFREYVAKVRADPQQLLAGTARGSQNAQVCARPVPIFPSVCFSISFCISCTVILSFCFVFSAGPALCETFRLLDLPKWQHVLAWMRRSCVLCWI
jgi:hypothetical protein